MGPLAMVTPSLALFLKWGILPRSGGWEEQDSRWARKATAVLRAVSKQEAQEVKRLGDARRQHITR